MIPKKNVKNNRIPPNTVSFISEAVPKLLVRMGKKTIFKKKSSEKKSFYLIIESFELDIVVVKK